MLNLLTAAYSSDAMWAWYSARYALRDAITALEDAGAALRPLIAATEWHAKGVMALHELIIELNARTTAEVGELENRFREIGSLVA